MAYKVYKAILIELTFILNHDFFGKAKPEITLHISIIIYLDFMRNCQSAFPGQQC